MSGAASKKLRILDVFHAGERGKFCANAESLGWLRDDGERMVVHPSNKVRRAEMFQGQLRVLCGPEEGVRDEDEVFALEGFAQEDFDSLSRYFFQSCGVHVQRLPDALDVDEVDDAIRNMEEGADLVDDAASGSAVKRGRELDLLKRVESVNDSLEAALRSNSQALNSVFSANGCERIGRVRLILDTLRLEVGSDDQRWLQLGQACSTMESRLRSQGSFQEWRPSKEEEHASLLMRHMARELFKGAQSARDGAQSARATSARAPPRAPKTSKEGNHTARSVGTLGRNSAGPEARSIGTLGRKVRTLKSHPNSILEGWVWKRSRFLRRWRRRWLVLLPGELLSFKDKGSVDCTSLASGPVQCVQPADVNLLHPRSFVVALATRTYFMICDTEEQRQDWIREIGKALVHAC